MVTLSHTASEMSRAALMCCTALALALSVGAAHAGPEIPWQFHGRWCSQEHKYGTDTLIFGRQGSVADCNMEISRHALVAGSKFTMQCEPLEIIRGCPAFLLNIEKRSLPRLMLSGDGLASNDAV